ncbi:carotenoid oxygenase family protein [Actinoallomurus soli]|uniref:carotenoid oxygenase family protein n=1 Tax=Actinoallomurus soli TaxID=2952535 RepID=UPI002092BB57|nr:carotenoid oxygenase family protein [Actinoallomurus soli]MCO5967774.1 carotenoid oxygenase family protein [Actinoallomurus soli]
MSNPFLEGGFAPVRQEHTVTDLPVTGTIPAQLDGRYLRNGPNPVAEVDPETYNWFTGDGMVHGVRIRDGRAEWYRNRWIRTPRVAAALGEAFRSGRSSAPLHGTGANTNVIGHAGRTLALVEAGLAIQELTDELDTVGFCDFDGTLPGGYTAHPKRDPETGELHAVSYFFGRGNEVRYSVIDRAGHARRTVDVRVTGSPMMHDFSLTESHVVFYDLPVTFDARQAAEVSVPRFLRAPARLVMSALVGRVRVPDPIVAAAGGRSGAGHRMPYRWNPAYPARVGVMPRSRNAGDVRWFEVEPCYVFHPLNAYDDGDTIVLEVVRHARIFDRDLRGPTEGTPVLARWTVDLTAGKVREEQVDDQAQEFPRIDERLIGRRHRYGYALALSHGVTASDTILKHDVTRGTTVRRSFGAGRQAGEFVFEPSSPGAAEDDGVLMGFVGDPAAGRTDLMLLDAGTLETVAAVHLPVRVPAGFHGNWVPSP